MGISSFKGIMRVRSEFRHLGEQAGSQGRGDEGWTTMPIRSKTPIRVAGNPLGTTYWQWQNRRNRSPRHSAQRNSGGSRALFTMLGRRQENFSYAWRIDASRWIILRRARALPHKDTAHWGGSSRTRLPGITAGSPMALTKNEALHIESLLRRTPIVLPTQANSNCLRSFRGSA